MQRGTCIGWPVVGLSRACNGCNAMRYPSIKWEIKMPIFNVQIVQRVTKNTDAAGNERVIVDRIIASTNNVIALDNLGAAVIAGGMVPTDYDVELLGVAMVRVQEVVK